LSLGPPFDSSGLSKQIRWGLCTAIVLTGGLGYLLATAGRTLGRGAKVTIQLGHPGPIKAGARLWLAGDAVGEVREVRWRHAENGKLGVELETFIGKSAIDRIPSNSVPFVITPSILGEAALEMGPPRDHAAPARTLVDGDVLIGADPPNLDDFLVKVERSLTEVEELVKDDAPAAKALAHAVDDFLDHLRQVENERGRASRILDQGIAVLDGTRELLASLRAAGGVSRVRTASQALSATVDELGPELRAFAARADDLQARLRLDISPTDRLRASAALGSLGKTARTFERLTADIKRLIASVERGDGALGAFLLDRELFDDLHETHRIIKSQPLRFLLPQLDHKPVSPFR